MESKTEGYFIPANFKSSLAFKTKLDALEKVFILEEDRINIAKEIVERGVFTAHNNAALMIGGPDVRPRAKKRIETAKTHPMFQCEPCQKILTDGIQKVHYTNPALFDFSMRNGGVLQINDQTGEARGVGNESVSYNFYTDKLSYDDAPKGNKPKN